MSRRDVMRQHQHRSPRTDDLRDQCEADRRDHHSPHPCPHPPQPTPPTTRHRRLLLRPRPTRPRHTGTGSLQGRRRQGGTHTSPRRKGNPTSVNWPANNERDRHTRPSVRDDGLHFVYLQLPLSGHPQSRNHASPTTSVPLDIPGHPHRYRERPVRLAKRRPLIGVATVRRGRLGTVAVRVRCPRPATHHASAITHQPDRLPRAGCRRHLHSFHSHRHRHRLPRLALHPHPRGNVDHLSQVLTRTGMNYRLRQLQLLHRPLHDSLHRHMPSCVRLGFVRLFVICKREDPFSRIEQPHRDYGVLPILLRFS
ncbi:hypothetical protein SALB_07501 [Streptomyces noursei]|uniref:Uncharacterized protein n=1 Tax=Streptomyces noursei TaxID=1971 RepID=A0A401RAS1_STRNR|nr:hypothetical protein SALB_07501 [Streptomyces noursei]